MTHELDSNTRFVVAGTAEDPLMTERMVAAIDALGISVYARPARQGPVDQLTTGAIYAWWEIFVPEADVSQASMALSELKAQWDSKSGEAERAAEEESQQSMGAI